jgi:glycosyltransferase involved in cell wall biosynthesis
MRETISVLGYWIPYLSANQLQGFPPPRFFLPALEAVGYDVDFVNIYETSGMKVNPLQRTHEQTHDDILGAIKACRGQKIILSYWDYIYNRDLEAIFSDPSKKILFNVNWNEEPKTVEQKIAILQNSSYVTVSQDHFRDQWWQDLGPKNAKIFEDKLKIWRFPCTIGASLNKEAAKKRLGISTTKSILMWGYYGSGKGADDILQWCSTMFETSVLFCGTPAAETAGEYLLAKSMELNMKDRVCFSKSLISDEEADLWFSAADIVVVPYWHKIGESALAYALGHNKVCITSDLYCFKEYADQGACISTTKEAFKDTLEKYLNDVNLAKIQEQKARDYAQKYNWQSTAIQFKELLDAM